MPAPAAKPRLLLHVCCGPCAAGVLERLLPRFEVTLLWYNPNLSPAEEHARRYEAARLVSRHRGVPLRAIEPDAARWREEVAGLEGEPEGGQRCALCFAWRLRRAAQVAGREGFEYLATTLAISPHKDQALIHRIGVHEAERCGVAFLAEDFRKGGGLQHGAEMARELGLYRQNYCGCEFSRRDR